MALARQKQGGGLEFSGKRGALASRAWGFVIPISRVHVQDFCFSMRGRGGGDGSGGDGDEADGDCFETPLAANE